MAELKEAIEKKMKMSRVLKYGIDLSGRTGTAPQVTAEEEEEEQPDRWEYKQHENGR